MTRIRALRAGWRDPHLAQSEADSHFCRNGRAIFEIDEMNLGPFRRRRRAAGSPFLGKSDTICPADDQQRHDEIDKLGKAIVDVVAHNTAPLLVVRRAQPGTALRRDPRKPWPNKVCTARSACASRKGGRPKRSHHRDSTRFASSRQRYAPSPILRLAQGDAAQGPTTTPEPDAITAPGSSVVAAQPPM